MDTSYPSKGTGLNPATLTNEAMADKKGLSFESTATAGLSFADMAANIDNIFKKDVKTEDPSRSTKCLLTPRLEAMGDPSRSTKCLLTPRLEAMGTKNDTFLGLHLITEFHPPDETPTIHNVGYLCTMCGNKFFYSSILPHVACMLHRKNYMKKYYPSLLSDVKRQAPGKTPSEKFDLNTSLARTIHRKEGLRRPVVKIDIEFEYVKNVSNYEKLRLEKFDNLLKDTVPHDKESFLERRLSVTDLLLGIEHVIEFQVTTHTEEDPEVWHESDIEFWYYCDLCHVSADTASLALHHIVGLRHRKTYISLRHPEVIARYGENLDDMKNKFTSKACLAEITRIVETEGKKKVQVRVGSMTEAKKGPIKNSSHTGYSGSSHRQISKKPTDTNRTPLDVPGRWMGSANRVTVAEKRHAEGSSFSGPGGKRYAPAKPDVELNSYPSRSSSQTISLPSPPGTIPASSHSQTRCTSSRSQRKRTPSPSYSRRKRTPSPPHRRRGHSHSRTRRSPSPSHTRRSPFHSRRKRSPSPSHSRRAPSHSHTRRTRSRSHSRTRRKRSPSPTRRVQSPSQTRRAPSPSQMSLEQAAEPLDLAASLQSVLKLLDTTAVNTDKEETLALEVASQLTSAISEFKKLQVASTHKEDEALKCSVQDNAVSREPMRYEKTFAHDKKRDHREDDRKKYDGYQDKQRRYDHHNRSCWVNPRYNSCEDSQRDFDDNKGNQTEHDGNKDNQTGYDGNKDSQRGYDRNKDNQTEFYDPSQDNQAEFDVNEESQMGYDRIRDDQTGYDQCQDSRTGYDGGKDNQRGYARFEDHRTWYKPSQDNQTGFDGNKDSQRGYDHIRDDQMGYDECIDGQTGYDNNEGSQRGYEKVKDSQTEYDQHQNNEMGHYGNDSQRGYHHIEDNRPGYDQRTDRPMGYDGNEDSQRGYDHVKDNQTVYDQHQNNQMGRYVDKGQRGYDQRQDSQTGYEVNPDKRGCDLFVMGNNRGYGSYGNSQRDYNYYKRNQARQQATGMPLIATGGPPSAAARPPVARFRTGGPPDEPLGGRPLAVWEDGNDHYTDNQTGYGQHKDNHQVNDYHYGDNRSQYDQHGNIQQEYENDNSEGACDMYENY